MEDGDAGGLGFDDTVAVEDGCETPVLNFSGETQVLDYGGETQVLDCCLDGCDDMGTQLLDVFDDEETQFFDNGVDDDCKSGRSDQTEVLGDGDDDVANDDAPRSGDAESLEIEKIQRSSVREERDKGLVQRPGASNGDCCNMGELLWILSQKNEIRVFVLEISQ